MKKLFLFLAFIFILSINAIAQTLYVCERYDNERGPIGRSTAFTTGYVTVVVESNKPMYYDFVYIQFDRLDSNGEYRFYKRFPFYFPNGYRTVYFSRSGDNDMTFHDTGFYRVWLLNEDGETITYTTVEIVK